MHEMIADRNKAQELLLSTCSAAMDLAEFAEGKDTANDRSGIRLIIPPMSSSFGISTKRPFGTSLDRTKSPEEHRRWPSNALAITGQCLRRCTNVLRSSHAGFAIRVACAVLCSQLAAFLRQTQRWYNEQRVVWASITVRQAAIGCTRHKADEETRLRL